MADVLYTVETRLSTAGTFASGMGDVGTKAAAVDHSIRRIGDGIAGAGEKLGGMLDSAVDKVASVAMGLAKIGGAAVIGAATYGVVGLNKELENTRISLSAIFQVQGFAKTWGDSWTLAGDQVAKMKQDVKSLPGDLGQLSDIMKMIATPAAQGGLGPDAIRKLAGRTMLVGTILGVQQETASREMAMLLAGRAGAHNILGTRLGLVGEGAQAFNKESAQQRVADISKLLDQYKGAEDAFSKSFIANWTTLKDNIKYGFLANATAPLFDKVKGSIISLNEYFDEHKDKVEEIANTVGRRLAGAWQSVEDSVKKVAAIVGPMLDRLIHMDPAEMFGKLQHGAEGLLAAKLGAGALSGGGSLLTTLMRSGAFAGGGEGAAGLGGLAAAAGAAFGAASVAAVAVAGAVDDLTDSTLSYHDQAVSLTKDLGSQAKRLGETAAPAVSAFKGFVDYLGLGLLQDADYAMRAANGIADAVSSIGKWIGELQNTFESFDDQLARAKFRASVDVPGAIKDHTEDAMLRVIKLAPHELFGQVSKKDEKAQPKGREGHGGMTIQKVELVVSSNQDPSQIAKLVEARLASLARHPRTSRLVPNYSASR